jgi:hypothetical protein
MIKVYNTDMREKNKIYIFLKINIRIINEHFEILFSKYRPNFLKKEKCNRK